MRKQPLSFAAAVLAALLMLAALPALAQSSTLGLSADDYAFWTAANAASGAEQQMAYAFTLTLNANSSGESASANLSGSGAIDTVAQAFSLVVSGTASANNVNTPLNAEIRVVDGNFYINATDPSTGQSSGWLGDSLSSLSSVAGSAAGMSGLPVDPAQMGSVSSSDLSALTSAFANFDSSEFISIARAADDKIGSVDVAHFVVDLSLSNLMQSSSLTQALSAMQSVTAASGSSSADMASAMAMMPMLGQMFGNSTITFEQYIGLSNQLVERAVLTINLNIDPAMMGQSGGTPASVQVVFDVNLSNFGEPPNIQAPDGAQMGAISSMMSGSMGSSFNGTVAGLNDSTGSVPSQPQQQVVPTLTVPNNTAGGVLVANTPSQVQYNGTPVTLTYVSPGNETVNIVAHSVDGALDTTLTLEDASGTQLAFNDDHGSDRTNLNNFDSLIAQQNLRQAGTYQVVLSTFAGSGNGTVEVTVETQAAAEPTASSVKGGGATGEPIVVQGQVGNNEVYSYTFEGTADETVTITARATDNSLDTVLDLIGPNGDTVASNDDHGTNDSSLAQYDSRISDVRLPGSGTYTVHVRGFAGASGSFELSIVPNGAGTPQSNGNTGSQTVDTVNETLRSGEVYDYTLNANAGDVYTITAHGLDDTMDTILAIYDADNTFLFSNDDHSSNDPSLNTYDSRISRYIFQNTGTYTVELTGYQDASGRFQLTVERVATGAPTGSGTDQVFTGSITGNNAFDQDFTATAGSYVTITVRALSTDFDPSVALISPDGVLLESNDDVGNDYTLGFYDARITNFVIPSNGTYTVEVTGYRGSTGSFALVVNTK